MSSPRPLLIDLARHFGGAEVRVLHMAKYLGRQGCQVACLQDSPLANQLKEANFQPFEIPVGKSNPRLAGHLRDLIGREHFDVVDAHNVQSYFWSYLALHGLAHRPAAVATVHSSTRLEQKNRLKGYFYETVERWTLPRYDHLLTVSAFLCDELKGFGIAGDQISRIPNGIQARRATAQQGLAIRQELGLSASHLVIGAVGRLEAAKGLDILLQAVKQLLPVLPNIRCVLVGTGEQHDVLKQYCIDNGLDQQVIFTGFRSDIPDLLEAFDVFAMPSRTEGIPFALLEACISERPIVASRVGGIPEVIHHQQTGLLVDPENVEQLAQAIQCLLQDRTMAAALGGWAASDISMRYTLENMVAGTFAAYQMALSSQAERRL